MIKYIVFEWIYIKKGSQMIIRFHFQFALHQNFVIVSVFTFVCVNCHPNQTICQVLHSPQQAHIPILTIAACTSIRRMLQADDVPYILLLQQHY